MSVEPDAIVDESDDPIERAIKDAEAQARMGAVLSVAKVLYEEGSLDFGVEPNWDGLPEKSKDRWLEKATKKIAEREAPAPARTQGSGASPAQKAPPRSPVTRDPRTPPPILAGDGTARSGGGGFAHEDQDTYVAGGKDREGENDIAWEPPYPFYALRITRGSLGVGLKLAGDELSPDVQSCLPTVLAAAKDGLLRAQQANPTGATMPLRPQSELAIKLPDGRILTSADRLDVEEFEWDETDQMPALSVDLEEISAQAAQTVPVRPVGLGNPVVIGTEGHAGEIIGIPVAAPPGAPQVLQPAPAAPARVAPYGTPGSAAPPDGMART